MKIDALLQQANPRIAKNNKHFFELTLTTKTDTIKGYLWREGSYMQDKPVGKVYSLDYTPGEFNTINSLTITTISPYEFIPSYYNSEEEAVSVLMSMVKSVQDTECAKLLSSIFSKYATKFIHFPAAKGHHHAKDGGLLKHSFEVFSNAVALSKSETFSIAGINLDVIKSAAILHDIGKLFDYNTSTLGVIDYTRQLYETSHLSYGAEFVRSFYPDNNPNIAHICHIIRSHHGPSSLNWGSVVSPATLEAHIIFVSDYLSMHNDKIQNVTFDTNGIGRAEGFRDIYLKF